jgi:Ca-activated chloride channel family protein
MSRYWNIAVWEYDFYAPEWLWGIVLVPVIFIAHYLLTRNRSGHLRFSRSEEEQREMGTSWVRYFRWGIVVLQVFAVSCMVVALARPYHSSYDPPKIDYKNGIDIILSIDASGSMLAQDFQPNRLEAAKGVAQKFVDSRRGDRVGLVVYEGEAYTACPATLDYQMLKKQIAAVEPGYLEPGTAIGNGLGVAVTRLRSDSLKSKVIILLTDGSNNAGTIEPLEAAQLAKAKKCRVYTIGVGSKGMAPTPVMTPFGISYENLPVEIDEATLREIADETGGKYFRATDEKSLTTIYAEIDKLEKRKMEDMHFGAEPPVTILPFLLWAIGGLIISWLLNIVKFKLDD